MTKHIEQTYQVLDEISHIRKRTGMYAGSVSLQTTQEWVYNAETKKMEKQEISYIPALVKIFSEILDNAIDESRRAPDVLDSIRVSFEEDGTICVQDNGRGIPVEIHRETGQYIAETVFSNLRAGSNFNDDEDQQLVGTNGVGSTLTSVLSTRFKVESCDGKKVLRQEFWNGMRERSEPVIKSDTKNRTKITFTPDYEFFKLPGLTDGNKLRMIKKVVDAAACNTGVKFYVNGDRIAIQDFNDYVAMYTDEFVADNTPDWKVAVSSSDGFEQISFVNSVETYQGGTHVTYVTNQIVDALRAFIEKKHKVKVSPGDVRGHLRVYIAANVNRPRFSSQTKENMISPVSEWKTSWTVSDKMINKIIKSNVIQSILDWVSAKAKAAEMAELRKLNKEGAKFNLKHIKKFNDATSNNRQNTSILLAEGDSAAGPIRGARDPKLHGVFPLRGRPINVSAAPLSKVKENEEFENIRLILGLKYGEDADLNSLNFGKVIIASDADEFGHSIAGLILNMFYRLWPNLVKAGRIYRLVTPVAIVQHKKEQLEFFTLHDFEEWRKKNESAKYTYKFLKGLGSSPPALWKKYMTNLDNYLVQFTLQDAQDAATMDLCFLKDADSADKRKVWLDIE